MDELRKHSTAQLVEELRTREGVTKKVAEPYERWLKLRTEITSTVRLINWLHR